MNDWNHWVLLDNGGYGLPVNLGNATELQYGGDFPTASDDQKLTIFIYQAVQTNAAASGKFLPNYRPIKFATVADALTAYQKLLTLMVNGGATDFRSTPIAGAKSVTVVTPAAPVLTSYTASPVGSDTNPANANINGSSATIAGSGFTALQAGALVDGTNVIPVTFLSATTLQAALPAYAAGTVNFDYQYRDVNGNTQTVAAAIAITFS